MGWSRANLIKKLKENPGGVTLVLKKIPESVRLRQLHPVSSTQVRERYRLNSFASSLQRITCVLYIPCVKLDPAFCYFLYDITAVLKEILHGSITGSLRINLMIVSF